MENSEKMNNTAAMQEDNQERTFTQEEVNEIVRKRLARERDKTDNNTAGADKEKELADRELRLMAREKLFDSGMPSSLADILRYDDEKSLEKAIEEIKKLSPVDKVQEPQKGWGSRHSEGMAKSDPYRTAMGLSK